jgi:hypothetical protein
MPKSTATLALKSRPAVRSETEAAPGKPKARPDVATWSRFVSAAGRIRIGAASLRRG